MTYSFNGLFIELGDKEIKAYFRYIMMQSFSTAGKTTKQAMFILVSEAMI